MLKGLSTYTLGLSANPERITVPLFPNSLTDEYHILNDVAGH